MLTENVRRPKQQKRRELFSSSAQLVQAGDRVGKSGFWATYFHFYYCSIEEVAAAAPHALKWFQLYIYKDRKVTENLVKRAENSGFAAIVLTIDAPYFGKRLADVKNKFQLPSHLKMANFVGLGDAETQ